MGDKSKRVCPAFHTIDIIGFPIPFCRSDARAGITNISDDPYTCDQICNRSYQSCPFYHPEMVLGSETRLHTLKGASITYCPVRNRDNRTSRGGGVEEPQSETL